jgi:hypothetical protein
MIVIVVLGVMPVGALLVLVVRMVMRMMPVGTLLLVRLLVLVLVLF